MHSYTTIQLNNDNDNGFGYLHAELCGTKYTSSISHTQKISDFLDRLNSLVVSDMTEDCVCCQSLDTSTINLFYLQANNSILSSAFLIKEKYFYTLSVKTSRLYEHEVRAPPIV